MATCDPRYCTFGNFDFAWTLAENERLRAVLFDWRNTPGNTRTAAWWHNWLDSMDRALGIGAEGLGGASRSDQQSPRDDKSGDPFLSATSGRAAPLNQSADGPSEER